MALKKTWAESLPSPVPDASNVTSKTEGGVEEKAHYYVTSGDTETILGQKSIHNML